jgi:hypothetical protein
VDQLHGEHPRLQGYNLYSESPEPIFQVKMGVQLRAWVDLYISWVIFYGSRVIRYGLQNDPLGLQNDPLLLSGEGDPELHISRKFSETH